MRILVAGGAGFLGSNLCAELIDRGDSVYCLDNLSTGAVHNIAPLFNNERFHFLPENVIHPQNLQVDQIYNCASPTAPGAYQRDPQGTMEANTTGVEMLLKLAEKTGATILQTSTVKVTEECAPDSKHWSYIEGKRRAEALCLDYHACGRARVKIARLNNTYGPRMAMDDSRVVPQFVMKALKNEPLTIWGGGGQRDSFCYVDDLIRGLIDYMNSDIAPGPIEFGNPEPISIWDLANLTVKSLGSLSIVSPNGVSEPFHDRLPDITEAKKKLNWRPLVPLEEGLVRLGLYFSGEMDLGK